MYGTWGLHIDISVGNQKSSVCVYSYACAMMYEHVEMKCLIAMTNVHIDRG